MELENVGQIIATRIIKAENTTYVVNIGLPQQFPDSTDFYCPVRLDSGEHQGTVAYSAGIDAVQALQLTLKHVGGMLLRLNLKCGGKLRWDGDEHGDLGFPLPDA